MSTATGIVNLRRRGGTIECPVEVHNEDEEAWYGYNLANPFAGYRTYPKASYEVAADNRV